MLVNCPNCQAQVRVLPRQLGRVLRCPKCGGRFLADPGLPRDAQVEDFAGDPPPIQQPPVEQPPAPPDAGLAAAFADDLPGMSGGPGPLTVVALPANWKGVDVQLGWTLFGILLLLEFIAGALILIAWGRPIGDPAYGLLVGFVVVVLAHSLVWVGTLMYVAYHSSRYCESVAPWLLLMLLYQGFGLALYLLSRPAPHVDGARR